MTRTDAICVSRWKFFCYLDRHKDDEQGDAECSMFDTIYVTDLPVLPAAQPRVSVTWANRRPVRCVRLSFASLQYLLPSLLYAQQVG